MNSDLQDYDTSLWCIYLSHMHTTLYWQLISNSGNCSRESKKSPEVKTSWLRKQGTRTKNRHLSRYSASEKQKTKIQKRIFLPTRVRRFKWDEWARNFDSRPTPKNQNERSRLRSPQLIHMPHCWPEVRALRTFLRLRRPCGSAHGGLERWRAEKRKRSENKNSVTNHHATTIERDTNQTLNHILPSKSGGGSGRGGVGRNEVGEV